MIAAISLLVVLTLSIIITRVATIALVHTGLARQAARFQARSAFSGVGYTTSEAEKVVNHPVRRKILMLLMLLGNAGIVTAVASMMLTFVNTEQSSEWLVRIALLVVGISALWAAAQSQWLDRRMSRLIGALLKRWTDIDARDYASLFHLGGEYQVIELRVEEGDWLADRTLAQLRLPDEGVVVLGVEYPDGSYMGVPGGEVRLHRGDILLLYGRKDSFDALDRRERGIRGALEHQNAVVAQRHEAEKEREKAVEREKEVQSKKRAES